MTEQFVTAAGGPLCVETFGDPAAPAVLLVAGAAMSMDWWELEFCERVAAAGRRVICYDHRDTGRSVACPAGRPDYSGVDLATDALRVLDGLGIVSAHLVGVSMGGGIAQQLAAHHPRRLRTLTLIATSPAGTRADRAALPPMNPRLVTRFAAPTPTPDWDDRAAVVEHLVAEQWAYAGSLGVDEQRVRPLASTVLDRTRDIAASMTNHWIVIGDGGTGDGEPGPFRLAGIEVPTLVLHGTDDPLFPFGHGEALAAEIPGASLVPLEGMGHEVPPPPLWDVVVAALVRHTSGGSGVHSISPS